MKYILITIITSLIFASCRKDVGKKPDAENPSVSNTPIVCDTSNSKYSTKVAAIITSKCVSCHSANSASGNLSSYLALKPYAQSGELYKRITGTGGFALMPQNNKLPDCEIETIKTWINNGYKND